MQLSKSDYMLYLKHPAWLWLKKHDKSKLPAVDDALQAIFDDGKLFEKYANKLFPDAVQIGCSFQDRSYLTMPLRTRQAINNNAKTILQGRVEANNITCIFDVLERVNENEFDLIEIKSSTEVKEEHIFDLAFQAAVLENAGLKIRKISVIHVNNEYVRHGKIDTGQLTICTDVSQDVRNIKDQTKNSIKKAVDVMFSKTPPDFSPRFVGLNAFHEWMVIYELLHPQTYPHNIYKLIRLNPTLIGKLEDLGVKLISDIPNTLDLHPKQHAQIKVTRENKQIIDKEKIREFLSQFVYPLYFFDYETFSSVIPPFDGIKPYQQVPFQYSLHILDSPNGNLTHKEFLHTTNSHPGLSLLQKLKQDIGDKGTVLVWYESFEKGRNTELGELFPEYTQFMINLNERIVDLMIPFSNNWFSDKDFFGSASIKKVLPVLVSELSYEKLEIKEGNTAQRKWMETVFEGKNVQKKDQIMKDLIEYCKTDTLAMVELFRFLSNIN